MSEYNGHDSVNEQFEDKYRAAGNAAQRKIGQMTRRAIKDTGKKVISGLARKGVGSLFKVALSALATLLAPLIPFVIGLLVVSILITSLFSTWRTIFFNDPSASGAFQIEASSQNNIVIRNGTTIEQIETSLGNDLAGIFYTKYAKEGYYYTIDDNPTVFKGSVSSEVKDFEGRESLFLLSPQMLMALDNGLNDGYKIPEQFIKPVYNSCLTTDASEKSTNGYCRLLDLYKDGQLAPQGNAWVGKSYKSTDPKPEGVSPSFSGFLYVKSETKTGSIYDWGLAPIFHYKSFTEEARVTDYAITMVEIYNPSTRRKEFVNFADLTPEQQKKYPSVPDSFTYGSSEDKATGNSLPKPSTKYAIDNVVSFLGTISNQLTQTWVPQGIFKRVGYIRETVYESAFPADLSNPAIKKRVCSNDVCYIADIVTKLFEAENDTTYIIENNTVKQQVNNVTAIDKMVDMQLSYTKEGIMELNTVQYVDAEPDTTGIVGINYLADYIDAYQTYLPLTSRSNLFACYAPVDWRVHVENEQTWTSTPTLNWDRLNDNEAFTYDEAMRMFDSIKDMNPRAIVTTPRECKNNEFALAVGRGAMDKFYIEDMPNAQYLAIAKLLNYRLASSQEDELLLESSIGTIKNISKPNYSSYLKALDGISAIHGESIAKYSREYGIDSELVYAIIMTTNQGKQADESCELSSGCGVMQVKPFVSFNSFEVFNNGTNAVETITIDRTRLLSDKDYNIRIGVAQIQYLMKRYNNNLLLALQAYTSSPEDVDLLIEETKMNPSTIKDIRWTAYRTLLQNGDAQFIEKVLSNTTANIFKFNINQEIVNIDHTFIHAVKGESATSAITNLNQFLVERYFSNNTIQLEKIWDLLYLGQKHYDSSKSSNMNVGYLIDTLTMSESDKSDIIKSVFAFSEGLPIDNYENLSQEYWRAKVRSLFMNNGPKSLMVFYNAQQHISGNFANIIPTDTFLIPTRPYGRFTNSNGGIDAFEDVEYQLMPNSEIRSITDGRVISISKGKDGQGASIVIAAPAIISEKDGVKTVDFQAILHYTSLKEINPELKVGDNVKSGSRLGFVSEKNNNKFNLSYFVNGESRDPHLLLEFIKYMTLENSESSSTWSNKSWLLGLSKMDFSRIDFKGSSTWFNPVVGTTRPSAGTWEYSFGTHDAVDIPAKVGTNILALGDGVILDYRDSTKDFLVPGKHNFYRPTPINYVLVVMKKDGYVYTAWLAHAQQNSVYKGSYTFKEGDVLANVGDNGRSTGPHLHMSVINHGNTVTIQDIVNKYLENPGKYKFGINPGTNPSQRCENSKGKYPCGVPIDKVIFGNSR